VYKEEVQVSETEFRERLVELLERLIVPMVGGTNLGGL